MEARAPELPIDTGTQRDVNCFAFHARYTALLRTSEHIRPRSSETDRFSDNGTPLTCEWYRLQLELEGHPNIDPVVLQEMWFPPDKYEERHIQESCYQCQLQDTC